MKQSSSDDARRNWRRLLNDADKGEPTAIMRYGETVAFVVSADWFRRAQTALGETPEEKS